MNKEYWAGTIQSAFPYIAVLVLSGILRFSNLMNPFSFPGYSGSLGNNGTDEGVFLMTGRLVNEGYRMYSDINTQQGPLFSFIIEILNGDPLLARSMTVILSLAGVIGMMLISGRSGPRRLAMASSLFLALNYVYFKESRRVSFDLYATVMLIFGLYALQRYFDTTEIEKGRDGKHYTPQHSSRTAALLVICGVLFSFSVMSKLFAVIPILSLGSYMLILNIKDRKKDERNGVEPWHIALLAVSTLVPTILLMSIYGFSSTLDGMLLDNLSRPSMPIMEKVRTISLFILFTLVPIVLSFVSVPREWRDRNTQLMLVWAIPLFIFIIFQSTVWEHYLILLLPPICYLGGRGFVSLMETISNCEDADKISVSHPQRYGKVQLSKMLVLAGVLYLTVSLGFETVMVFTTDRVIERDIAREVEFLTDEDDLIISGDPIIGVYAGRLQPPRATNLAMVRYPMLTDEELINITVKNDVSLVIITYELSNFEQYIEFIKDSYEFHKAYTRAGSSSSTEGEIPIGFDSFNIYLREGP